MTKKILTLLICSLFLLSGCDNPTQKKPTIVSTTGMINDIAKNIGGDAITPISLMGPGIDPHLYKASAGDVQTLNNANLILYNGLHLEAKMIDIFEKMNQKKPTIAISKNIPKNKLNVSPDYKDFPDPHIWFDVSLWIMATKEVTNALIKLAPDNEKQFKKNETVYIKKLNSLNNWITAQINQIPIKNRHLVTAHDAFSYFGDAYNFNVVGLQGISTAAQANTKDIQNTATIILQHKIPTIHIESSVPIRQIQALQAAVKAKGWNVSIGKTLYTDALGDPNTPEGTYIGMMKHNVMSIVNGLK